MIRPVAVAALLMLPLSTAAPAPALAHDPARLSFGGGVATRSVGGLSQLALPFELTLQATPALSLSAGAVAVDSHIAHAYGELALNFVVTVGAGVGYGRYEAAVGAASDATLHLLVAVPIPVYPADFFTNPLGFPTELWWGYLLPYYRPAWGPWPGVAHEGGVMFKMSYRLQPAGKLGG